MPAKIKRGDRVVVIAGKDRGKRGTVRHVLYLGATLEYRLELEEGERGVVEAPNGGGAPKFQAGDAVWFSAPLESCLQI